MNVDNPLLSAIIIMITFLVGMIVGEMQTRKEVRRLMKDIDRTKRKWVAMNDR